MRAFQINIESHTRNMYQDGMMMMMNRKGNRSSSSLNRRRLEPILLWMVILLSWSLSTSPILPGVDASKSSKKNKIAKSSRYSSGKGRFSSESESEDFSSSNGDRRNNNSNRKRNSNSNRDNNNIFGDDIILDEGSFSSGDRDDETRDSKGGRQSAWGDLKEGDIEKSSKKARDGKGKDSKKAAKSLSRNCRFQPTGRTMITPDDVISGRPANGGQGAFRFEFTEGFQKMEYSFRMNLPSSIPLSSITDVELFCAPQGDEVDTPILSLDLPRSNRRTFSSQIKNVDIEETECVDDGSVINNIGTLAFIL